MIGQQAAEGQVPAGRGEAAAEQLDQQQRVDVAAGQQHYYHRRDEAARVLKAQQQTAGQDLLRVRRHPTGVAGHGSKGSGKGNFKALFGAIEREQARCGNL
jgi:hypothetical protein